MDSGLGQIQVAGLQRRNVVAPHSSSSSHKLAFLSEFYYRMYPDAGINLNYVFVFITTKLKTEHMFLDKMSGSTA
jgi:hypothetical protein